MERTDACSRKSLHVLRIPLAEAKTDGLDRTLSARSAHAERTLNSKCLPQTAERDTDVRGTRRLRLVCAKVLIPNQSPETEAKVTAGRTRRAPADHPLETR
jgi:hypothetical protein